MIGVTYLKPLLRPAYRRLMRIAPRARTPYATHLPVLTGISILLKPQTVIELGAGEYSTGLFLDRAVFSDLRRLVSFENNGAWFAHIKQKFGSDPRLDLRAVQGEMCHSLSIQTLSGADLIFVDDADDSSRARTLRAVAACCPNRTAIVVHDAELWRVRLALRYFPCCFLFDALNPQTAVLWGAELGGASALPRLNQAVKRHAQHLSMVDHGRWTSTLTECLSDAPGGQ